MSRRLADRIGTFEPSAIPGLLMTLYRRAPATVATVASVFVSYLINAAYLDWTLYRALGEGGTGKPTIPKWLIHALVLRPLSMSSSSAQNPDHLPPDEVEWREQMQSSGRHDPLQDLPSREGKRPEVFGFIPHRQIEKIEKEGSEYQKEVIFHLVQSADQHAAHLTLALSSYENTTSPSLFVRHPTTSDKGHMRPTHLSRLYLSGNPPAKRNIQGEQLENIDASLHELAHIHVTEGSMHITLSPQDARQIIKQGWGELHRLSGLLYRGHYVPPHWIPLWLLNKFGGQSKLRWSYLERKSTSARGKLIPPTYCLIYAANTPEQVKWVKTIINSSIAWAIGQPI